MPQLQQCSECESEIVLGVGSISEEPASKSGRERRKEEGNNEEDFDPFFATRFIAACDCQVASVYVNTSRAGAFLKSGKLPDAWKPELEDV